MRLRVALATLGIALLMPQTGSALPKGKPFEELNALIQENATAIDENGDLIEQNSTAILSLSSELTALDGRLGVLETDVDGLTTQFGTLETAVSANTSDITLAFAQISAVQAEINQLDTAVAENAAAIADAEAAIQAAEVEIAQLYADLATLNDKVNVNEAAIADVETAIAAAETVLAQLQTDVIGNADAIADANQSLDELYDSLASLDAIVQTAVDDIDQAEAAIVAANASLATLQTQHADLAAIVSSNADASEAAIAALEAEVLALIAAVEGDVATHEAELVQLRQDLLDLAAQNSAVAQGLQDQMLALALLVDSNSTSITALQAEVSTLSGTLATLNSQYNALSASHLQLQVHVADHHTELDDLRAALAAITARIDMEHPPPDPVAVFSFTDVYATNDTAHVDSLRQFFRDTVTAGRWVHAVTATAAVSRVTEACVLDPGNAFDVARDNVANTTYGYSATGFYRENNGIWAQYSGNSQIRNSNASFQTVAIFVGSTHQYLLDYQSPPYSAPYPLRDTYHQNNFWTDSTQSSTTVTYTVGDTRSDACGF